MVHSWLDNFGLTAKPGSIPTTHPPHTNWERLGLGPLLGLVDHYFVGHS